jgi:pteridine reductase
MDEHLNKTKTAIVTGAAQRIGRELSLYLAKSGYDLLIHYHQSKSDALSLKAQVESMGQKAQVFSYNLQNIDHIEKDFSALFSTVNNLSLLINNASWFAKNKFETSSTNELVDQFRLHSFAPIILSKVFKNYCKKGHIINMLDTRISQNNSDASIYTLAKKSLSDATNIMALNFSPTIQVNAIAPGSILPPKINGKLQNEPVNQKNILNKVSSVKEILNGVDYLLKQKTVTGQCLYIDGGSHLL